MPTKKLFAFCLVFAFLCIGTGFDTVVSASSNQLVAIPKNPEKIQASSPLGSEFPISQDSISEIEPAVAYNSLRQEYLVVWYNDRAGNDDIRARRINWDGKLLGGPFYISAGPGGERRYPDVVYNSAQDEYLVVWEHEEGNGPSVRGRRISGIGEVLGSNDLIFADNPSLAVNYLQPVVSYASTEDKYLLVYRYDNQNVFWQTIIANEIDSDAGNWTALNILDYNTPVLPEHPRLVYNHARNEFLVVWQQGAAPNRDAYGRRVKMSGGAGTLDPPFAIGNAGNDETNPVVAAIPTAGIQGLYLIAWEYQYVPNDKDIRGLMVNGDGTLASQDFFISSSLLDQFNPAVSANAAGRQFLVTWTDPLGAVTGIRGRTVSLGGNLLGDEYWLAGDNADHAAVSPGLPGDFLMVFDALPIPANQEDIFGRTWGNRAFIPITYRNNSQ